MLFPFFYRYCHHLQILSDIVDHTSSTDIVIIMPYLSKTKCLFFFGVWQQKITVASVFATHPWVIFKGCFTGNDGRDMDHTTVTLNSGHLRIYEMT